MLVERGDGHGLAAIVRRFNKWRRDLQSLIIEHARHLFAAVRQVIGSPLLEERAGAV